VAPAKLPATVALDAALRDQVVGVYELPQLVIHIYVEGGQLMSKAEGPGQGAFPLLYFGNDTFGAAFDPSLRLQFHVENGVAKSVTLSQGGGTNEGKRRP